MMLGLEKIYLVDSSLSLIQAWQQVFAKQALVHIYHGDYFDIAADAIVSPSNSFGIMDGGLDLAIRGANMPPLNSRHLFSITRTKT